MIAHHDTTKPMTKECILAVFTDQDRNLFNTSRLARTSLKGGRLREDRYHRINPRKDHVCTYVGANKPATLLLVNESKSER